MKIVPKKISILIVWLLSVNFTFAAPDLPVPNSGPSVPVGLPMPIDEDIILLLLASLIFAFYKIRSNKKASR